MLEVYAKQAPNTPLLQRALILSFAKQMQLPVNTLLSGLIDDLAKAGEGAAETLLDDGRDSLVMNDPIRHLVWRRHGYSLHRWPRRRKLLCRRRSIGNWAQRNNVWRSARSPSLKH